MRSEELPWKEMCSFGSESRSEGQAGALALQGWHFLQRAVPQIVLSLLRHLNSF